MKTSSYVVPYNYLPMQFADPSTIIGDWEELIRSGEFTLGPYVEHFEAEFAKFVGADYCVSTNNGTDALLLALKALNIGRGDEVITPCNSFYATTGAIVAAGATPVFCDVDSRYQASVETIEKKLSSRTRAVLPVHWGGASPHMPEIIELAGSEGLSVIEDACMAIGGSIENQHPGTFGDIGAFSMHPLKSLNVMGDGGMVTTNNSDLAAWMKKYRNHGMVDRDTIEFWGVNMRLQPLQAVVASRMILDLPSRLHKRREIQKTLDSRLAELPGVTIPRRVPSHKETVSLYMILAERRDQLLKHLSEHGVEAKIHYPIPLHLQKPGLALGYSAGDMVVAESQANALVTLPAHEYLNGEQINHLVSAVGSFREG